MDQRSQKALGVASTPTQHPSDGHDRQDGDEPSNKKARTFLATLACDACRARKSRCDEDRPQCGYCRMMRLECTYQTPRPTKKDQSMTVAINAIRRLEAKVEELTEIVISANAAPRAPTKDNSPRMVTTSKPGIGTAPLTRGDDCQLESSPSPQGFDTPIQSLHQVDMTWETKLSFSQHAVPFWPAMRDALPADFMQARDTLRLEYVIDIETNRPHLPMHVAFGLHSSVNSWLAELPLSVIKGLADAYFAEFHRNTPVLDKHFFFSNVLGIAMENEFGYNVETCLVLIVLALGCLAVKAYEEGDFPLPTRYPQENDRFVRPEWYNLALDEPAGLSFFNEARRRMGFLMTQNDLQTGQFYMLSTLYYAQLLRPVDSWTTVNRAALCCMSILSRTDSINSDNWEMDMFSRLFWNTLMYETIITQELNLPLSGLLGYEADVPILKFTPCPRPKTSLSGLVVDEDDSFFNFHFLAQAAHRIILTRIRHNLYVFGKKKNFPSRSLTAEMHHQLEQWRTNLPPALQFSDRDAVDDAPSPAHVIARAMLQSRYRVAIFHIGRPFLYKALHAPAHMTDSDYVEIRTGLGGAMNWPTINGKSAHLRSALPIKFGWSSQCFGQVLLFHVVARSQDPKLRDTLPVNWQDWMQDMMRFLDECGKQSPGVAKDVEMLRLL